MSDKENQYGNYQQEFVNQIQHVSLVDYSDHDSDDDSSDFITQTPKTYSKSNNPVLPGCSIPMHQCADFNSNQKSENLEER